VRFSVDPRHRPSGTEEIGVFDTRDIGLLNDSAYWVSDVTPRAVVENADLGVFVGGNAPDSPGDEVIGTIDAASHARPGWQVSAGPCSGEPDGPGLAGISGNTKAEADEGGESGLTYNNPHLFQCQRQSRAGDALEPVLDLSVTALSAATIDLDGAGLTSPTITVNATGDGPIALTFLGASSASGTCIVDGTITLSSSPCVITLTR
jgi:hypothetical protein